MKIRSKLDALSSFAMKALGVNHDDSGLETAIPIWSYRKSDQVSLGWDVYMGIEVPLWVEFESTAKVIIEAHNSQMEHIW